MTEDGNFPADSGYASVPSQLHADRLADLLLDPQEVVDTKTLDTNLVEVVHALLSPLYEKFDFTRLPLDVVQYELARLRARK